MHSVLINALLELAKFYLNSSVLIISLRGLAREEQVSKTSQLNKVQAVLSQICDYSPLSVN